MAEFPAPKEGLLLTYLVVSADVEASRHFYADVLGGETVLDAGDFAIVALANGWVTITAGGGPTPDKPTVTLRPPVDPSHASGFLNIRVADIESAYRQWPEVRPSSLHPSTVAAKSAVTCEIPTGTSSRSVKSSTRVGREGAACALQPAARRSHEPAIRRTL
jgi:hypothetical protein